MITLTERGLYCSEGGFYIDPSRGVETALITHAHSDHLRRGSKNYYCAKPSTRLLERRLGPKAKVIGVPYGEKIYFGCEQAGSRVCVSFHPAGHMLGSAQVRVESRNEVWVASGDYKRAPDLSCEPFEVVKCDTFITEATFGHPRYSWQDDGVLDPGAEIHQWWETNTKRGLNSVLFCYSMGKSQRVLADLATRTDRHVYVFGETFDFTEIYRLEGVEMVPTRQLEALAGLAELRGELIVAPHAFARSEWMERVFPFETGFASGWMQSGAFGMGARYDRGFVMSDHADWKDLIQTITETEAKRVLVLHAKEGKALIKHLNKIGIAADGMEPGAKITMRKDEPIQPSLF